MPNRPPVFDDREDAVLTDAVAALVESERALAELEAARVVQFAAAMRVALERSRHRPRAVQEREMALRSIAAEIGVALRWNDRTVQRRLDEALQLVDDFPATLQALAEARISARHAAVIRDVGVELDDPATRASFESRVIERAATDTVAGTRAFARALVEELHPVSISERFAQAEQQRRVWIDDDVDGMARLGVLDGAAKIRAMYDRLTRQARAIRSVPHPESAADGPDAVDDRRTIDQVRADLLCDLVLTGQPTIDPTADALPGGLGAIRAHVSVVVPALTAAGASDRGASIDGQSPIDADTARQLLAGSPAWDRVVTHPVTGAVLAVDRYRPSPAIQRFVRARDVHCRFPGCRRPARACEIDHSEDHARGGPTARTNLACLCTRHHTLKTETSWTARQGPDGSIEWTSPLGNTVTERPERYVAFVPEPDPPPF
ncbi:HNH endonuclease signature motif containing protein [Microbacterium sp. B19]|uniref:HNH endonuclease signature motif containing protein n=1 Tax=Microbacterium sp. B19 TaxID=96765 RepID=UPI00055F666F|nr:HNH endonuclease signature motif containing protein [Microbacterium sp. B19]